MAPDGLDIVKTSGVGRSTGLECLVLAAGAHRIETSVESIRHEHQIGEAEPSDERLAALARAVGLKAKRAQTNIDGLMSLGTAFPVLARLKNGNVVLVVGVTRQEDEQKLMVIDPLTNVAGTIVMPPARFDAEWSGSILLVRRPYHFSDTKQPFGLRWFLAEVLRQKGLLRDVMLAALAIQVVGLAGPTYMRVVLDRVLVHQSVSTLAVLTAGTVVALAFETGFTYLRTFIMLHATKKIDIRLATRIFAKMLSLPISYFEAVAAGVTIRHLQQADKIRGFLTGRMLGVILEVISFAVYLPILAYLSIKLTLVVLAIGLMIAGTVAAVIGPFRVRLQDLYNAESQRQAMAVETVSGMRTIKSLTLEPVQRKIWEERSANSVEMFNNVAVFGTYASSFTSFLERIAPIAVISIGAIDIFAGNTTVGAVLAFQMLAGRVISPLVQVAALVQEYQDTALSVRMLGEIMNRPSESETRSGSMRPVVKGEIALDGITFRYVPGGAPALDGVGLKISAGMVVAVVGRSGSGKSTIAKLLQGLYMPQEGVIRIDGVDIREYDLSHLRQNVCVIPQDTFIFRGSVRDNIGLPKPGATLEEIVAASQSSGANEFIERMPQGYDTLLEEGGQNLSGGQKQRLSIARALLISPPILILDEATSALDPDSEAIFMDNLEAISAGRTTLIISHRLNTLISCDAIIVLERGKIIDAGTHQQLLSRCAIYEHLWKRQNRHL